MTKRHTRRGFTLIELLVVVLIIGILAAVALPQYQVAVKKTQLAKYLPLVKSLVSAEESYYWANGNYTPDLTALDIDMPNQANCTYFQGSITGYYLCETNPIIKYGVWNGPTNAQAGDDDIRYLYFFKDDPHAFVIPFKKGDKACFSKGAISRKVCKTLGPGEETESTGWNYIYKLK